MQNKDWIFSALIVESFSMFPTVIKNKFLTNLRELGGTYKKYVRSKYLLKNSC